MRANLASRGGFCPGLPPRGVGRERKGGTGRERFSFSAPPGNKFCDLRTVFKGVKIASRIAKIAS